MADTYQTGRRIGCIMFFVRFPQFVYFQRFPSFVVAHVGIIQDIGDFFGTFVNDESIVNNASYFFCFKWTEMMIHVLIPD
jgi:hypothetical protein